jgi:hypothetical protein
MLRPSRGLVLGRQSSSPVPDQTVVGETRGSSGMGEGVLERRSRSSDSDIRRLEHFKMKIRGFMVG